jgi:RHS repeat-associated protein
MLVPNRHDNSGEYRFGYGGHEKDDEVKGNGNHLSFGDMGYDPRIGRRWRPDPYEKLYVPISPYAYALNNPIKFTDSDGNIVVDEKGNPVTITVSKNKDGTYSSSFAFVEGTSQDVQKNFLENGGRAIRAAIQVQTGRESVSKAIESSESIHYTISPDKHKTTEESEEKTIIRYKYGETKIGRINETDESGKRIGIKTFTEEVTIYEGTIDASIQDNPEGGRHDGLTKEQRIGATFVHETEHATDPTEVKNRKAGNPEQNEANHDNVRAVEDKAIKEYKEDNDEGN